MRNLSKFLVHLFGRDGSRGRAYLSLFHDQCLLCEELIGESQAYLAYRVCPYCRFHYTLSARERVELLADRKTFKETQKYLNSVAPLSFSRKGAYHKLLTQDKNRTGLTEAAVTGSCRIGGTEAMLVVLDFGFMGGSMGAVVGEKVATALETAARKEVPLVALVTGGGTRVQEGVLSLMQMAKTVTAANRLRDKGMPLIVVLANPSTGQAYASFANLADVILAEPGSLIGLSPLRTMREASDRPLPLDAHTAEAHLNHGLLDIVVDREALTPRVARLLQALTRQKQGKANPKDRLRSALDAQVDDHAAEPDAWESVAIARDESRPLALNYMRTLLDPFIELHGDRLNSDDRSVIGGLGYLCGEPVAIIGQQRSPRGEGGRYHVPPEGLRKAQRIINLASRFKLPLITLIDTQGADPGLEAEEQGIGNAIASTLSLMSEAPIPIVSVIIGEAGSEGALALGLSDRVLMQQFAVYSPISLNHNLGGPYPDHMLDREAAEALMLTAQDCVELGIVDQIIPEPPGGSHTSLQEAANVMQASLLKHIAELSKFSESKLLKQRYQKFRRMGETSNYSQEAMNREVELLMAISSAPRENGRNGQSGRESGREEDGTLAVLGTELDD